MSDEQRAARSSASSGAGRASGADQDLVLAQTVHRSRSPRARAGSASRASRSTSPARSRPRAPRSACSTPTSGASAIPRMLGAVGKPVGFNDMILPLEAHGVKVISMGLFVPEETPVIWRGPMLHKAIEQFLGDVYWGDLDFLLLRPAPGHGRREHLARVVPAGRLDARRDDAAGGRADRRRARRQDGRAARTCRRSASSRTCRATCARTAASASRSSAKAAARLAADDARRSAAWRRSRCPGGPRGRRRRHADRGCATRGSRASVALREAAAALRQATKSKVGKPLSVTAR